MTTSGVVTYNIAALEIITEALALLRVAVGGEALSSDDSIDALRTLNLLIMDWKADGLHLWTKAEAILFLIPGQASYGLGGSATDHCSLDSDVVQTYLTADASAGAGTILVSSISGIASADHIGIQLSDNTVQWTTVNGAPAGSTVTLTNVLTGAASANGIVYAYTTRLLRPTRILNARRRMASFTTAANIDVPITILERPDYFEQPNKLLSATPTMVYYDPQLLTGKFYIWSAPTSSTDTIRFTFERPLEQFVALTDTADVPQEWLKTLCHVLAADLAPKHSVPLQERALLEQKAMALKAKVLAFDREYAAVNFQPDLTMGGGFPPI